ncbi:hypothetical protein QVD17_20935 [Tagetes erecta]|uniref:F-box domain-containing protein n=1 Tax=Tagetes erecta TaxID=13708 RepID=A0AAD8NYN6_TARER|nr:hypothetical protein QVD17_20935 [Tagetes erecta]
MAKSHALKKVRIELSDKVSADEELKMLRDLPEEVSKKMDTKELSLDRISTLPDHIFQNILTRMPIKDALRTSILQKNWRYSWRAMPKLVFTDDMVKMYEAVFKDEDGDEEDEDEDDDEDGNDDFDDDYSDDAEEDEDDYNVDREEEEEDDDYDDDHDEEEAEEEKFRINQQTSNNFFDVENNSDLKLDHLETLKMRRFSNLRLEREFVKLIMAKSPALKKVRIQLSDNVSALELKMVKELVLHSFLRASPFVKLIIERPKKSS